MAGHGGRTGTGGSSVPAAAPIGQRALSSRLRSVAADDGFADDDIPFDSGAGAPAAKAPKKTEPVKEKVEDGFGGDDDSTSASDLTPDELGIDVGEDAELEAELKNLGI